MRNGFDQPAEVRDVYEKSVMHFFECISALPSSSGKGFFVSNSFWR